MDFITGLHQFFKEIASALQQSDPLTVSVVFAGLIVGMSFIVAINVPIREARIVFVMLLAVATFVFSQAVGNRNESFFFNLSTEFIGAAVGLLLFADMIFDEIGSWLLLLFVSGLVLVGPFVVQSLEIDLFTDEFILNLRTDLLGAFVVTLLLKRGWIIYAELRKESLHNRRLNELENLLRLQKEHNMTRLKTLRQWEGKLKIQHTRMETMPHYFQAVEQAAPPAVTTLRENQMVILLAGHTLDHCERTIYEVFDVHEKSVNPLPVEGAGQQISFVVEVPQASFAHRLRNQFDDLMQTWHQQVVHLRLQGDFSQPDDSQSIDFFYGAAAGYQRAMDDLHGLVARMADSE